MKTKITERDYIKAHRKVSREEEIALPGSRVHRSRKVYDRNKIKAILTDVSHDYF